MKTITLLLLLLACQCSFGQADTNLLVAGGWSAPVTNAIWPLRGRLLVYDAPDRGNDAMWPQARVYVELKNLQTAHSDPLEFYFDGGKSSLDFEMRDGNGKPVKTETFLYNGVLPEPFWVTLPSDSTVRIRVDLGIRSQREDGLEVCVPRDGWVMWVIRPETNGDYYLSAQFSAITNHASPLGYHVWRGTLQLPQVRMPVEKIRKR